MKRFGNYYRFILYPVYLLLFLQGCDSVVDLEMPEVQRLLVVNSTLSPDSHVAVKLSSSAGVDDFSARTKVENATIELYENNVLIDTLIHTGSGLYELVNFVPSEGSMYKINVSAPGFSSVSAEDRIPEKIEVQKITADTLYSEGKLRISLIINDPVATNNYYEIMITEKQINGSNFEVKEFRSSDPAILLEKGGLQGPDGGKMAYADFTDNSFNGKSYTVTVNMDLSNSAKILTVHFASISEALYDFHRTFEQQTTTHDSPLSEPMQIYTNIRNGLGIFGGFSASSHSL